MTAIIANLGIVLLLALVLPDLGLAATQRNDVSWRPNLTIGVIAGVLCVVALVIPIGEVDGVTVHFAGVTMVAAGLAGGLLAVAVAVVLGAITVVTEGSNAGATVVGLVAYGGAASLFPSRLAPSDILWRGSGALIVGTVALAVVRWMGDAEGGLSVADLGLGQFAASAAGLVALMAMMRLGPRSMVQPRTPPAAALQEKLEFVVAASPFATLVVDPDGQILGANEVANALLLDGGTVAGRKLDEFLPQCQAVIEAAQAKSGSPNHRPHSLIAERRMDVTAGNGRFVPADVSVTALCWEGVQRFIVRARDISHRVQLEADNLLKERALAATSDGIAILDGQADGVPVVYSNPAFAALLEHDEGWFVDRNLVDLLAEGEQLPDLRGMDHDLTAKETLHVRLRHGDSGSPSPD